MTEARFVTDAELSSIDWSTTSLDLGIARGDGKERWLPLDQDDLKILIGFLTRPLLENGKSAADCSDGLRDLTKWARAALDYSEKKGLP